MQTQLPFRRISVIGLGYIGLPTAAMFASRKIEVVGVDVNPHTVETINRGEIHIIEPDLDIVVQATVAQGYLRATTVPETADAFLIAVPTPFKGDNHEPDLSYVEAASKAIAPVLKPGDLVVLESTSPVGATSQMADWLAEARPDLSFPQVAGEASDIRIAHCPERVLPGKVMQELIANDRIIGGMTRRCSREAALLYKMFVSGDCIIASSPQVAEMAKLARKLSDLGKISSLVVLILIYYNIIFVISAIFPSVITDQGIPLGFESELNLKAAATFTSGALLLSVGAYFPNLFSKSLRIAVKQKRENLIDEFRIRCILISSSLFAVASILISGASSYSEYVEGGIGLKVTTALLAAGGLPAAILSIRGWTLGAALLFYSLPCLVISIETGVRLMTLVPIGTIFCSYIMRNDKNIISFQNSVIAILAIFPLSIFNSCILIPLRGSESSILNLPDSNVIGWFLAYYDRVDWGEAWSLDPIIRMINGYLSYPLSRIGYNSILADDPAHTWARNILMVEGAGAYHMPMTFALDLKFSAGPMFWISAFCLGLILYSLEALSRITLTSRILLTPCIVITSFLIARGSLTHAGTTVSAVVVFITIITIAIEAISFLRLRKISFNGSVIGQTDPSANLRSS